MVRGVRIVRYHVLHAKAAYDVARAIKLGMRRKGRACSRKRVGEAVTGQLLCRRPHIGRIGCEVAEFALQAQRPGVERAIAEGRIDAAEVERAHRAALSESCHVFFEAVHIHDGVRGNVLGIPRTYDVRSLQRVGSGQLRGRQLEAVLNGKDRGGNQARIDGKRRRAGKEVILPDIGRNGSHRTARVG